jgi:hypothetical protein
VITNNCTTCTPCEGCDPAKIVCEEGIKPCDICDPCNSNQRCSYCGNHLCKCDPIVDTDDGPMHRDCAKLEELWIAKNQLSMALDQIKLLREELLEAKDINQRLVDGNATEWDT